MRKISVFLSLLFFMAAASSCTAAGSREISKRGFLLDTYVEIRVFGTGDRKVLRDCFDLIGRYENLLSKTVEGSDVYRINHARAVPVEVSAETAELIRAALRYSELTGGLFDITVEPLTRLWNFTGTDAVPPDDASIREALAHVGYKALHISGNTVTLEDPGAGIDLGAVAKGYIGDRVADLLRERGVKRALINLGGNVVLVGEKSEGEPWLVGVQKPYGAVGAYAAKIRGSDVSMVSSGQYERYFEYRGKRYHHILDPRTGYPFDSEVVSATIVSKDGMTADILSTVCVLLGADSALALTSDTEDTEVLLIDRDMHIRTSKGLLFETAVP